MAGEHVDSLMVKLGLETDVKSFREANSQFAGIRTGALALGTAIIGVGAGMVKMSDGIAKSADTLGKWGNSMDVNIRKAQQWKYALAQSGSANPESEMMGMFANVEKLRTQAQRGQIDEWALVESGMNLYSLQGMDLEQGMEFLMRGISDLAHDPDRQRRALAALNFSGPAQHGVMTNYDATLAHFQRSEELGNAGRELYEHAAAYTAALTELTKSTDSLKDEIAVNLLPRMTEWIKALTGGIQQHKTAAANATEIILGDGTNLEKLDALRSDPEIRNAVGAAGTSYIDWINTATGWHPVNILLNNLLGNDEADTETQAATKEQARRRVEAASTGLSSDEMNYEPSPSELIPQSNLSEQIHGYKSLLHEDIKYFDTLSSVPSFGRSGGGAGSSVTQNYYSIDARGSTDPAATEAAVRRVVDQRISNAVKISRDGIPTNVE